jgi:hypothetical protein
MGLLICRYTGQAKGRLPRESTEKVESFTDKPRDTEAPAGIYQFFVTAGPDMGKVFPLRAELMVIGGKEPGRSPEANEVLLQDEAIPGEQLHVMWNSKESRYGIIRVEHSPLPSYIKRGPEDFETQLVICSDRHTLIEEGDRLHMGGTELKLIICQEPGGKTKGEKSRSPGPGGVDPQDSRKMKSISLQLPRKTGHTADTEKSKSPVARHEKPPRKLEQKKQELEKTDALSRSDSPAIKPDFELSVLSGPDKGLCYSFLQSDLIEERLITIGKRGLWAHAIELDEAGVEPVQAGLLYRQGKISIIHEGTETPIFLNSQVLEPGATMELEDGMNIQLGKTLFRFSDLRGEGGAQSLMYMLMLIEGVPDDKGMTWAVEKKRTTLGRSEECNIVFSDPDLSPVHARITRKEGKIAIELLSSSGLSLVNGVSLIKGRERQLLPGDLIRLSALTLLRLVAENHER